MASWVGDPVNAAGDWRIPMSPLAHNSIQRPAMAADNHRRPPANFPAAGTLLGYVWMLGITRCRALASAPSMTLEWHLNAPTSRCDRTPCNALQTPNPLPQSDGFLQSTNQLVLLENVRDQIRVKLHNVTTGLSLWSQWDLYSQPGYSSH
ncbi:hypothetical protein FB451DRAFT_1184247 [Mycena latifolia]|nr:hypothetical protein FB451DRAFT_1184247 [Mycena latifolia]